ncbi:MAG: DUF5671 domain-containing protein [bacterium]|nr:DUF5671 domain-containing protein [bacterium]
MNTKISAKDFFLQLGVIVTFYASVIALVTLLFEVINFAYPQITDAYQYYFPSISLQVATLIVAFPLFLFFSWLMQRSYLTDPALRESAFRRWLSYITLFIAGAVIAGDLVTVIYMFLDGQELTAGFLLKVLALLLIAGGIFLYYLREIRNQIADRERNIWRVIAAVAMLGSIIMGFMVIGSPASQREFRYDMQKVTDLQNIQWQVINYWQMKKVLPGSLSDLNDSLKPGIVPKNPETSASYEYERTGTLSFNLCANFNKSSRGEAPSVAKDFYAVPESYNWQHPAGRHCFERTIDPQLYPPTMR